MKLTLIPLGEVIKLQRAASGRIRRWCCLQVTLEILGADLKTDVSLRRFLRCGRESGAVNSYRYRSSHDLEQDTGSASRIEPVQRTH